MPKSETSVIHEHIPCPFCGLLCDDLRVEVTGDRMRLLGPACPAAERGFERRQTPVARQAEVDGQGVDLGTAWARAAEHLAAARHPVIGGLGADVSGIRGALALADRLRATVEHMDAGAALRNLHVLQDGGWMTTTLAELKNRADFVLILGEGIARRYPRLFERYIWPAETLFAERRKGRRVLVLGGPSKPAAPLPEGEGRDERCEYLPCPMTGLGEVAGVLRALQAGRPLQTDSVHGLDRAALEELLDCLRQAEYPVVIWAPAELDFPHAELAVQTIAELVRDLNETGRCSGLSLGGENGGTTSYQVCAWQTGFPVRMSFRHGYPDYDPYHYDTSRMLERGETDALLWISAFEPERLPPSEAAGTCIVLGHPEMKLATRPDVFIPVATAGIDHAGALFRCDGVVALPLRRLRAAGLPSVAEALAAIANHLD